MFKSIGVAVLLMSSIFALPACKNSFSSKAQNTLYPFAQVNAEAVVPLQPPIGFEQFYLTVEADDHSEMQIHGWYSTSSHNSAHTIVYFHGNGENLASLQASHFLSRIESLNANLVIIDYPGLGQSRGTPNEFNLVRAGSAALLWATSNFANSEIALWGRSLGAAVALQVALQSPHLIHQLILTSPWSALVEVIDSNSFISPYISKKWLAKNAYDSKLKAPLVNTPTLIQHGDTDEIIPIHLARRLHAAFQTGVAQMVIYPKRGHNDLFEDEAVWLDAQAFMSAL